MSDAQLKIYRVWDLPTRLFHWINFSAVVLLMVFGLLMLFKTELGITSTNAKIGLKTVHVIIGYVFVLNLLFRLVWGFIGNRHARWSAILPLRGFMQSLRAYLGSLRAGNPQPHLGHNPLGRLAVNALLLLMLVMAVTGLIRAGTDIYYPPFGAMAAEFIAAPGTDPASLVPYDTTGTDAQKLDKLKAFKGPIGDIHVIGAFVLLFLIVLHIGAVIITDSREGGALISAMFTGKKVIAGKPVDADD